MIRQPRDFDTTKEGPHAKPLIIGLVAPSGAGKTYSALRLATGMQRVVGGKVAVIDTESGRALHYKSMFPFDHIPLVPPHGPLDYRDAIAYAVGKDYKIIVVDSATHEHDGEGGVMDQSEEFLDRKCGDDDKRREKLFFLSLKEPKRQRNKLNRYITGLGGKVIVILCYRAKESLDMKRKDQFGQPREKGYQPISTSPLQFEMTAQFLLLPGSDGVPTFKSDRFEERSMIKMPAQFRGWFQDGIQLDEAIGERLARWSIELDDASPAPSPAEPDTAQFERTELRDTILAVVKEHGIPPEHVRSIIQKIKPNAKLDDLNIDERRAVLAAVKEAA